MDPELMSKALKSVLGEGYEARSHVKTVAGTSRTPSPHDVLQGRVSKSNPSGGDLHVPTTIGADKPKKRGKLKSVEYVGKAATRTPEEKAKRLETQSRVSQKLLAAGAAGGVLSLPSLASHTKERLRQAKAPEAVRATGKLRLLKNPKVGAGFAAGAAGLELAGLAGDFMGHHTIKEQRKLKTGILKALDPTPTEDTITFSKVDSDKQQVFGWCSVSKKDGVEVVDLQGDHIPIEETEKSAYEYMLVSRKGGNQHARITKNFGMAEIAAGDEPLHVGDVIESMVFTPEKIEKMGLPEDFPQGWWIGLQIHDDDTWGQIKRGERTGFSIHGKGRREQLDLVRKDEHRYAGPGQIGYKPKTKKQRAQSFALGTAGATAAGAGLTAAGLIPLAHRQGRINTGRADHLKGRLGAVAAVVGGAAGVYSGVHAAHEAAKPAVHAIPEKARKGKEKWQAVANRSVTKAWSPVVDRTSLESRRQRRAGVYQHAAEVGAVGAVGGAVHQGLASRRSMNRMVGADTVHLQAHQERAKLGAAFRGEMADRKREFNARLVAKPDNRGVPQMKAGHRKRMNAAGAKHMDAVRAVDRKVEFKAKAHNLRAVESAGVHSRRAGKLGLLGAGLAAGAGVINRKRKGSWKPYPGVR